MTPHTALHVALNATRYDDLTSGARSRAIGLAGALLRRGVHVTVVAPHDTSFAALVRDEAGSAAHGDLREVRVPAGEARTGRPAFPRLRVSWPLPEGVGAFVTDYHPLHARVPTVLTIHDLRHLAVPGDRRSVRGGLRRLALGPLARRAMVVVTPTAAVADDCVARLGLTPDRVAVVPNGLSRGWREAPPWVGGGPLVWVGTADRRKGFEHLLRALSLAAEGDGRVLPLVVVGRGPERFRQALAAHPVLSARRLVDVRGPLADDAVVELVRHTSAVVHPSAYEGFGMGVLEALAVGAPVLAGRCDAVAEVAGPGLALLPPDDVPAWRDALLRASRGDGPAPGARTVARARAFTWDAAAGALVAALRV